MAFADTMELKNSAKILLGKYCEDYTIIKPYAQKEVRALLEDILAADSKAAILSAIYEFYQTLRPSYTNRKLLRALGVLLGVEHGISLEAIDDYVELSCGTGNAKYFPHTTNHDRQVRRYAPCDPIREYFGSRDELGVAA